MSTEAPIWDRKRKDPIWGKVSAVTDALPYVGWPILIGFGAYQLYLKGSAGARQVGIVLLFAMVWLAVWLAIGFLWRLCSAPKLIEVRQPDVNDRPIAQVLMIFGFSFNGTLLWGNHSPFQAWTAMAMSGLCVASSILLLMRLAWARWRAKSSATTEVDGRF